MKSIGATGMIDNHLLFDFSFHFLHDNKNFISELFPANFLLQFNQHFINGNTGTQSADDTADGCANDGTGTWGDRSYCNTAI
ncbi:hypothetical protein [Nitrosomonas sp.]|uniref:hypothetical protein n=1 Tax=Nitrosomonas sp. TaxID=42353 RepID=UPI002612EF55|nr:hypothetical protein [Nitrosomonas sp.]MCW5602731.1 hypothetical protein [Nitrosomonas sp.]